MAWQGTWKGRGGERGCGAREGCGGGLVARLPRADKPLGPAARMMYSAAR
jgi:hypothetical protein